MSVLIGPVPTSALEVDDVIHVDGVPVRVTGRYLSTKGWVVEYSWREHGEEGTVTQEDYSVWPGGHLHTVWRS